MAGIVDIIRGVAGGIAAPILDYLKTRSETKSKERIRKEELRDAMHERQTSLLRQGLAADATWEMEQIKNSEWKDEYVLIILSIPLVGCFIPHIASYILAGFAILDQTPSWYQWMIMAIFTAIYGIRIWRRQQSDT